MVLEKSTSLSKRTCARTNIECAQRVCVEMERAASWKNDVAQEAAIESDLALADVHRRKQRVERGRLRERKRRHCDRSSVRVDRVASLASGRTATQTAKKTIKEAVRARRCRRARHGAHGRASAKDVAESYSEAKLPRTSRAAQSARVRSDLGRAGDSLCCGRKR